MRTALFLLLLGAAVAVSDAFTMPAASRCVREGRGMVCKRNRAVKEAEEGNVPANPIEATKENFVAYKPDKVIDPISLLQQRRCEQ